MLIRSRSSCVQEEGERSKKEREIARKQGSKEGRNGNGRVSVNVVVDAKSIRKGNYYLGCGGRGAHLAKLIRLTLFGVRGRPLIYIRRAST